MISILAGIVSVHCGTILTPAIGKLVSEKVIESHGNSVVHASAPLVTPFTSLRYVTLVQQQPVAEIVQPATKASLITEKTIESHGHQVIHGAAHPLIAVAKPLETVESHVVIPTVAARDIAYATPIYYSVAPHRLLAEKTISSYGHSIQHFA